MRQSGRINLSIDLRDNKQGIILSVLYMTNKINNCLYLDRILS